MLKAVYYFLLFTLVWASCTLGSGKPSASVQSVFITKEKDTLAEKAIQIHAGEKNKLLDEVFLNKFLNRGFNGNVLVAQEGIMVYQKCFGIRDHDLKDSLKPNTKFQLASLTKTFTAVGVLKLIEQGKLNLKDKLIDFFPSLPFKKVTIEMLLCHRSGIPNYVNLFGDIAAEKGLFPDNNELIRWLENTDRRYIDRPGKNFSYSNSNYILLASIIEKVSKMSYSEFMRSQIFDPAGMKDTWIITDSTDAALANRAWSYTPQWEKKQRDNFDGVVGDKGIFSTVEDLYKWYDALVHYKILSEETTKNAWKPKSFEKPGMRNYGYGFRMVGDHDSDRVIFHNGWWNSYNSLFYISPNRKYVVIVLGNKYNPDIYDIHEATAVMNSLQGQPALTESEKQKLDF